MKTIKLRTTNHSYGMFSRQPRNDAQAGFDNSRMECTYVINNIPDDADDIDVISIANKTAFLGIFEADYSQLGKGAIVRERSQN